MIENGGKAQNFLPDHLDANALTHLLPGLDNKKYMVLF